MAHAIISIQGNTYWVWKKVILKRVAYENCVYGRFGLKWRLCIPISALSARRILYLFRLCSLNCMVYVGGGHGCEFRDFNKKKSSSDMSHTVCDIKSTHLHVWYKILIRCEKISKNEHLSTCPQNEYSRRTVSVHAPGGSVSSLLIFY